METARWKTICVKWQRIKEAAAWINDNIIRDRYSVSKRSDFSKHYRLHRKSFWRNFHNRRTFTGNFIWPWCMKFARFATKSTQVLLVLFSAITWRIFMTLMFWDAKTTILPPPWLPTPDWGSFFNYVDQISPYIDHLPSLYWHWWGKFGGTFAYRWHFQYHLLI